VPGRDNFPTCVRQETRQDEPSSPSSTKTICLGRFVERALAFPFSFGLAKTPLFSNTRSSPSSTHPPSRTRSAMVLSWDFIRSSFCEKRRSGFEYHIELKRPNLGIRTPHRANIILILCFEDLDHIDRHSNISSILDMHPILRDEISHSYQPQSVVRNKETRTFVLWFTIPK